MHFGVDWRLRDGFKKIQSDRCSFCNEQWIHFIIDLKSTTYWYHIPAESAQRHTEGKWDMHIQLSAFSWWTQKHKHKLFVMYSHTLHGVYGGFTVVSVYLDFASVSLSTLPTRTY